MGFTHTPPLPFRRDHIIDWLVIGAAVPAGGNVVYPLNQDELDRYEFVEVSCRGDFGPAVTDWITFTTAAQDTNQASIRWAQYYDGSSLTHQGRLIVPARGWPAVRAYNADAVARNLLLDVWGIAHQAGGFDSARAALTAPLVGMSSAALAAAATRTQWLPGGAHLWEAYQGFVHCDQTHNIVIVHEYADPTGGGVKTVTEAIAAGVAANTITRFGPTPWAANLGIRLQVTNTAAVAATVITEIDGVPRRL